MGYLKKTLSNFQKNLNLIDLYTSLIILIVLFLIIFTEKYAKNKKIRTNR